MTPVFNKKINTSKGAKEFRFQYANRSSLNNCVVYVMDDYRTAIMFRMIKDGNSNWVLAEQRLPNWILEIEIELNDAIQDNAYL